MPLFLEAELDRLSDSIVQLIERARLGMTTRKRGNGGDIPAVFVLLDHDVKVAFQGQILRLPARPLEIERQ